MAVCLKAIALLPEAVYRMELGLGEEDEHGRRRMSGSELAFAISFALTDDPPTAELWSAAREGKLRTREGVRSQIERLLDDEAIAKPKTLRFSRSSLDITVPRMCSKMRSAIGTTIGATSRINSCTRPIYWCCTFWIETRMCCVSC